MANEEYVKVEEFLALKEEVKEIKQDMIESSKLLHTIDKKLDVISEKVINTSAIATLQEETLEHRVDKIEDNQIWLRRTVIGGAFAILGEAILLIFKIM